MKILTASFGIIILFLETLTAQEAKPKPFSIRSGIIEYIFSGDKTGKATQYFDDYGMKDAVYYEIFQDGELKKSWVVSSGDFRYMWDPEKPAEGLKMKNPLLELSMKPEPEDVESYTAHIYLKMGMTAAGNEMFLGKDCEVFSGKIGKVLIWKGLLLLMDLRQGAYISGQRAISIKTDVTVDEQYFSVPANINFTEIPGF